MARRNGTEATCYALVDSVAPGSGVLPVVAPATDIVLSPKSVVLSSHGGGNVEFELSVNGTVFLHTHVPSNNSKQILFPEGLEFPKGSGISVESLAADGSVTLYYCKYDESPGVTKVASRAASFNNVTATRAPTRAGEQSEG
jgi:hypothetical protein